MPSYTARNERSFTKVHVFKSCRVLKMNLLGKTTKKIVQVSQPKSCVSAVYSKGRMRSQGILVLSHGWCTLAECECLERLVYWHFSRITGRNLVKFLGFLEWITRNNIHISNNGNKPYLFCKTIFFFGRDAQHWILTVSRKHSNTFLFHNLSLN